MGWVGAKKEMSFAMSSRFSPIINFYFCGGVFRPLGALHAKKSPRTCFHWNFDAITNKVTSLPETFMSSKYVPIVGEYSPWECTLLPLGAVPADSLNETFSFRLILSGTDWSNPRVYVFVSRKLLLRYRCAVSWERRNHLPFVRCLPHSHPTLTLNNICFPWVHKRYLTSLVRVCQRVPFSGAVLDCVSWQCCASLPILNTKTRFFYFCFHTVSCLLYFT